MLQILRTGSQRRGGQNLVVAYKEEDEVMQILRTRSHSDVIIWSLLKCLKMTKCWTHKELEDMDVDVIDGCC
jgi:hypothetical protein